MTRILLTGFEPFGQAPVNPSQQIVEQFAAEGLPDAELITAILPVAVRYAPTQLADLLTRHRPDWCVMLGLAEGRSQISIERVAINLADFRIPDNAGDQLIDTPIVTDGPDAYFSTLPVAEMRAASSAAGAPTELSLTAGAYLCNYVFYLGRHLCEGALASTRVGFIHLPATPELALSLPRPVASMSLDTMMVGLRSALAVLVAELTAID